MTGQKKYYGGNKTMNNGVFLFVCIALFAACIGAATGLFLADFIAAASIVWAWVIHEQGGDRQ